MRITKMILVLVCALLLSQNLSYGGNTSKEDEIQQTLPASVNFNVSWDTGGDSDVRNVGSLDIHITGDLKIDEQYSSHTHGMPQVMTVYGAKALKATYTYKEKQYQKKPPKDCPSLLAEYNGAGPFKLPDVPNIGQGLQINKLDSVIKKQLGTFAKMMPAEARDKMIDHYNFFAGSEKQTVSGKKRPYSNCQFEPHSKEISLSSITLRFKVKETDKMNGSRKWSVKKNSGVPAFTVRLSDLPASMESRQYVPEKVQQGEASYSVKWNFGKMDPVAVIKMKVNGEWIPISDQKIDNIVTGEKIELKGMVYPQEKDPQKGQWSISHEADGEKKRYIKKYSANATRGRVEYLDDQKDLKNTHITFYWTEGGLGKVRYETQTSGLLTATSEFDIQKPDFSFRTVATQRNIYGPLEMGESNEGFDCCPIQLSDEQKEINDKCDRLERELATMDLNDDWERKMADQIIQELEDLGCRNIKGIQYEGIKFFAEPQDSNRGEVQFVQLLSSSVVMESNFGNSMNSVSDALDSCYPFPKNISAYATLDKPAFGAPGGNTVLKKAYTFEMFLMFRPDKDGSEWVPVQRVEWVWGGGIRCENDDCWMDDGASFFSRSTEGTKTSDFPEWDQCSGVTQ